MVAVGRRRRRTLLSGWSGSLHGKEIEVDFASNPKIYIVLLTSSISVTPSKVPDLFGTRNLKEKMWETACSIPLLVLTCTKLDIIFILVRHF